MFKELVSIPPYSSIESQQLKSVAFSVPLSSNNGCSDANSEN